MEEAVEQGFIKRLVMITKDTMLGTLLPGHPFWQKNGGTCCYSKPQDLHYEKKKTSPADSPKNFVSYQQKDDDKMATYCIRHIIYTFCQPTRKINIFQTRKKRHWAETCPKNYRPVIRMILRLGTVCRPLGHIYLGAHG